MDELREAAKREIRRKAWASRRGKATRQYLRDHPELIEQFERDGDISAFVVTNSLPTYVTEASLILELSQRAKRRETAKAIKEWKRSYPEEARRLEEAVRRGE